MKIYNLENEGIVYCLVNPKFKQHLRYSERDGLFVSDANNYEESELTTEIPNPLRNFIFWTIFVAYNDSRYHNSHNNDVFDLFIRVVKS